MPRRFVRESKFRHVFGSPYKKTQCYDNVNISKNSWDGGSYCDVNSKFVAMVLEGTCGNFYVLPHDKTGRIEGDTPKVCGHKGKILDIKFNPFNSNVVATAGEDSRIKVWNIPDGGVTSDMTESVIDLVGHRKRVGIIQWHPTANNILASTGTDNDVIIWDVEKGSPVYVISGHSDQVTSMAWNSNGSLLLTTSKDKKTRIIDPRKSEDQILHEWSAHDGNKPSRAYFVDDTRIVTIGTTRDAAREIKLWNIGSFEEPLTTVEVDQGTGNLLAYYDEPLNMLYVASKGDCTIRYFEISKEEPYIHYLSQYSGTIPQRGFGVLPKNALNVNQCEIFRFYKLTSKNCCEPISMIVPRKSDCFQTDLYPEVRGDEPSLSAEKWLGGENADQILISLKDGFVPTKKEFTVDAQTKNENLFEVNLKTAPKREGDLRKAFYEQQDELTKLKEILKGKELRIRQLEYENSTLRKGSTNTDGNNDVIDDKQKILQEELSDAVNNEERTEIVIEVA